MDHPKRIMLLLLAAVCVGLVFAVPAVAATNQITNGTFSTGDLSGWTATPATNDGAVQAVVGGVDGDGYQAWLSPDPPIG